MHQIGGNVKIRSGLFWLPKNQVDGTQDFSQFFFSKQDILEEACSLISCS